MNEKPNPKKLDALHVHNIRRMQLLATQGVPIDLTTDLVGKLIDAVLPIGSDERAAFLWDWELHVADRLNVLEAEVRKAILQQPNGQPFNLERGN